MKGLKARRTQGTRAGTADKLAKPGKSAVTLLDEGMLPNLLGYNIRRAQIALWRDLNRSVGKGVFRPAAFSIMTLVDVNPGVAQIDIANQLDVDKATIVGLVHWLQRRKCVVCKRSAVDRRRQGIFLTDRGQAELLKLRDIMLEHEVRFTQLFSSQELVQLFTLLRRIHS